MKTILLHIKMVSLNPLCIVASNHPRLTLCQHALRTQFIKLKYFTDRSFWRAEVEVLCVLWSCWNSPSFAAADKYASLLGTNYCMWLGSLPLPDPQSPVYRTPIRSHSPLSRMSINLFYCCSKRTEHLCK